MGLSLAGCAAGGEPLPLATHVDDWRDEIIYQIVVDRFANGDPGNDALDGIETMPGDVARFQGGDWRGIAERLDYIAALGATTIWISPLVANVDRPEGVGQDGYHGYWAADFTRVNPRFGSLEELQRLVQAAHARDIKVIVDAVTNHTGRAFFYDFDGDGEADSGEHLPPYAADGPHDAPLVWEATPLAFLGDSVVELDASMFHRRGQFRSADQTERELGDFPTGLRDLDTEHPLVIDAMVDTYVRWVELTDVDGFRLDAVPHVPHAFWQTFARRLRARLAELGKHRFLLLGEVFHSEPALLAYYTDQALDSVFDFSLRRELIEQVIYDGEAPAVAVGALTHYREAYPGLPHASGVELSPWQARVAFADNHDMPRLRYWLDDPLAAELAMTVVFTVDAIPAVYYGTEQELDGGWGDASREPLWEAGYRRDTRMFQHIAFLSALRRDLVALRRGALVVRHAAGSGGRDAIEGTERGARAPDAGLLVFERTADDERVVVALNAQALDEAAAEIETSFAPGAVLVEAFTGQRVKVGDDGRLPVRVPPRRARIYVPEGAR